MPEFEDALAQTFGRPAETPAGPPRFSRPRKQDEGFGVTPDLFSRAVDLAFTKGNEATAEQRQKALQRLGMWTPDYHTILQRIERQAQSTATSSLPILGKMQGGDLHQAYKFALMQPGYFRSPSFGGHTVLPGILGEGLLHTDPEEARRQQARYIAHVQQHGIATADEAAVLANLATPAEVNQRNAELLFGGMTQDQVRILTLAMLIGEDLEGPEARAQRFERMALASREKGREDVYEFQAKRAQEIREAGETARRGLARGLSDDQIHLLVRGLNGEIDTPEEQAALEHLLLTYEAKEEDRARRRAEYEDRAVGDFGLFELGITEFLVAQRIADAGTLGFGSALAEELAGPSPVSPEELAEAHERMGSMGRIGVALGEMGVSLGVLQKLTGAYVRVIKNTPAAKLLLKSMPANTTAEHWLARQFGMPMAMATMMGSHAAAGGEGLGTIFTRAGEGLLLGRLAPAVQERLARTLAGPLSSVKRAMLAEAVAEGIQDVLLTVGIQGIENVTWEDLVAGMAVGMLMGAVGGEQVLRARSERGAVEPAGAQEMQQEARARMREAGEAAETQQTLRQQALDRLRDQETRGREEAEGAEEQQGGAVRQEGAAAGQVEAERHPDLPEEHRPGVQDRAPVEAEAAASPQKGVEAPRAARAEEPPQRTGAADAKIMELRGPVVRAKEGAPAWRRTANAEDMEVVWVPGRRFAEVAEERSTGARRNEVHEWVKRNPDEPMAIPEGGVDRGGNLYVQDGNNRGMYAYYQGHKEIPVAMAPEDAARFRAQSEAPQAPAPAVSRARGLLDKGLDPDRVADAIELEQGVARADAENAVRVAQQERAQEPPKAGTGLFAKIKRAVESLERHSDPMGKGTREVVDALRELRASGDESAIRAVADYLGVKPTTKNGALDVSATLHDIQNKGIQAKALRRQKELDAEPPPPAAPPAAQESPAATRIYQAIEATGKVGQRIMLADIRKRVPDLSDAEYQKAVLELAGQGDVVLFRLDDPRQVGPEDEAAAVRLAAGDPRHLLYVAEDAIAGRQKRLAAEPPRAPTEPPTMTREALGKMTKAELADAMIDFWPNEVKAKFREPGRIGSPKKAEYVAEYLRLQGTDTAGPPSRAQAQAPKTAAAQESDQRVLEAFQGTRALSGMLGGGGDKPMHPRSLSELGLESDLSIPAARRAAERLVRRGLLERVETQHGRAKRVKYRLTPLGQEYRFSQEAGMPAPGSSSRRQELPSEQRAVTPPNSPVTGKPRSPPPGDPPDVTRIGPPVDPPKAILGMIRELFNLPLVISKRLVARGLQGATDIHARVVAIDAVNNIWAAFHEIGHVLHVKFSEILGNHPQADLIEGQLAKMGRDIYPDAPPSSGYVAEGWAEATRLWLTRPNDLEARAPNVFKLMEEGISFKGKGWQAKLHKLRKAAYNWQKASLGTKLAAFRSQHRSLLDKPGWVENWVERGHPILKLMRDLGRLGVKQDPLDPDALTDPGLAFEGLDGSHNAIVIYWRDNEMTDMAGQRIGPPLKEAKRIIGRHRWDEFKNWMVARHGMEINARGMESGLADADLEPIVRRHENDADFVRAADIVYKWQAGVLEYLVQAGVLRPEEYAAMRETYPFYVPWQRALDRMKGGLANYGQKPHRQKGGVAPIVDPFEVMVVQAAQFVKWANSTAILNRLCMLGDAAPQLGHVVRRVDPSDVELSKEISRARDAFYEDLRMQGLDPADMERLGLGRFFKVRALDDGHGDVLWRAVDNDGNEAFYRVNPDFYRAAMAQRFWHYGPILDFLLTKPAKAKRLGTTGLRLAFAGVNVIRDFAFGGLRSATWNPLEWAVSWLQGWGDVLLHGVVGHDTDFYRLYERLAVKLSPQVMQDRATMGQGRQQRAMDTANLHLPAVLKPVAQSLKDLAGIRNAWRVPGDLVEMARDVIGVSEAPPRLAEMRIQARRLKKTHGLDLSKPISFANAMRLARAGRQVTVDFNAGGDLARRFNQIIPFFNAFVQGPRRLGQAARERPYKTALWSMGLAALSIELWKENRDKEWYRDLPYWERYGYWNFEGGLKIIKPFEIGAALSIIEGALDWQYTQDPSSFTGSLEQGARVAAPGNFLGFLPMPVLMETALGWASNYDYFLDRPIVPRALEHAAAEEQFGPRTTTAAKGLGQIPVKFSELLGLKGKDRWEGWSPYKIDKAIRDIFGGLGHDLAEALPEMWGQPGLVGGFSAPTHLAPGGSIPVLGTPLAQVTKRFKRSGLQSQAVNDFYDRHERLRELARSEVRTPDPRVVAAHRVMTAAARRMSTLRKRRNEAPPGLSLKELAEHRQRWLGLMRELAQQTERVVDKLLGEQ